MNNLSDINRTADVMGGVTLLLTALIAIVLGATGAAAFVLIAAILFWSAATSVVLIEIFASRATLADWLPFGFWISGLVISVGTIVATLWQALIG